MYSTCLFCHSKLGTNQSIEPIPIGRRVAFDAERGRLWVVCPTCGRWNLSPLEERWEAVEECERRFRETKLRTSTDNIGLARIDDGVDLIRVGKPLRPELAVWRYGARLMRRRRAAVATTVVATTAAVAIPAVLLLGVYSLLPIGFGMWGVGEKIGKKLWRSFEGRDRPILIPMPARRALEVEHDELANVNLHATANQGGGWSLSVLGSSRREMVIGRPAIRAAGILLRWINRYGGSRGDVELAVSDLTGFSEPQQIIPATVQLCRAGGLTLSGLPLHRRLALEMLANEEPERLAMEGEMAALERDWKDAEEVAGIADGLLVPEGVEEAMQRMRREADEKDSP